MSPIRARRNGFTLIEILIVVIILGILAAIVIPQFTSASQDARKSSVASTVQTLRSQIALYKLQHGDTLPDLTTSWDPFLKTSVYNGQTLGPYMQSIPVNSLLSTINPVVVNGSDGTGATQYAGADYVYDYAGGAGSGNLWAVKDAAGNIIPQ